MSSWVLGGQAVMFTWIAVQEIIGSNPGKAQELTVIQ